MSEDAPATTDRAPLPPRVDLYTAAVLLALGLGVVYIGALRNDAERVARILGLPARSFAVFGLCVGWPHPDTEGAVKPRLPQRVVLHHDTYGSVAEQGATVDAYDARMAEFYAEQRMNAPAGG